YVNLSFTRHLHDYFDKSAISSVAAPPISSHEQMNIQNSENFVDDDLEFDDDNDNTEEIGSSSKSSNNQKTGGLPKKKKKRKFIAEAWQYFDLVGSSAICQVEIVEDGKTKKCGRTYDRSNSNSTTTMNYHITQEHDIVLQSLAKK
ncbi:28230_t:CDS:2, partial [Racocetra persica]